MSNDRRHALFEGKVALVTGATAGIGRATAMAFAREGARVVLAGRREREGQDAVRLLCEAGHEACFFRTDVSIESEVRGLIERAMSVYGRLDCAFNNAGVAHVNSVVEGTSAQFDLHLESIVKGTYYSMKYEIPAIRDCGGGAIVNSSSIAGLVGISRMSFYSSSKAAILGLTRSAAIDVAKWNIRINAVCPAAIAGVMEDEILAAKGLTTADVVANIPLGRHGVPEDVAAVVLFLASDAASFMTGAVVPVDGGWSAR